MEKIKNFGEFSEIYEANIFTKGADAIRGISKKIASRAGNWLLKLSKAEKDGTIPIRSKKYNEESGKFDLEIDDTGKTISPTPVVRVHLPEGYGSINTRTIGIPGIKENKIYESDDIPTWKQAQKTLDPEIIDVDGPTLEKDLAFAFEDPESNRPLLIWGAPGIGKTSVVKKFGLKDMKVPVIEVILSLMEPTDIAGLPGVENDTVNARVKRSVNYLPMIWPLDNGPEDKGGIIFLDEINRAHPSVQAAMLKVVLDREIAAANYKVPSKWLILAAANRPEDEPGSMIKPISFALADRFAQVNFISDPVTWAKWARSKDLSDDVVSFVELMQEHFYKLPHMIVGDELSTTQGVTPRSWDYAAGEYEKKKKKAEALGKQLTDEEIQHIFSKHVGNSTAGIVLDYIRTIKVWPSDKIAKIYNDPADASLELPTKSGGKIDRTKGWAIMYVISKYKTGQTLDKREFVNLMKYLNRINDGEMAIAEINLLKRTHPEIKNYFADPSIVNDITPVLNKYKGMLKEI